MTDEEIETYVDFFEDLGFYESKGLLDLEMVDESLGDYIIDCYEDDEVMKYIGAIRGEERDSTYWEYFERLARQLVDRRARRRSR